MDSEKVKCIQLNKEEYGEIYPRFKWPTPGEAEGAVKKREALLESLESFKGFYRGYKNSKLYSHRLSPGCGCCGEGTWSCLFINNLCNARCMFCPTEQSQPDEPTTNTLPFPKIRDYIDYIDRFRFKGVSISGGEPLMTYDRTQLFLTEIKKRFGANVYMWLYTNGIGLDTEKLIRLKYTGLDEIRFNLGAVNYQPDKVKLAIGKIPQVTVEIPVIPGDVGVLKERMVQWASLGVDFLNLHQLRCTPYNCRNLLERGYTFLHGRKVTVLESELAALELLKFGLERELPLAVNYCSFVYKNRYQALAPRRRFGLMVRKPYEDITESGYLRGFSVKVGAAEADRLVEQFKQQQGPEPSWFVDSTKTRVFFNRSLWEQVKGWPYPLLLSYDEAFIRPFPSFRYPFLEVPLNPGRKVVVERRPILIDKELSLPEIRARDKRFTPGNFTKGPFLDVTPDICEFEHLREGLAEYY